jgi:hypothetical protein
LATGDRVVEFRLTPQSRYDDELVQAFEALQALDAARPDASSEASENSRTSSAAASGIDAGPISPNTNQCSGGSWPYSTNDCLWAADSPKRRRIVTRLKSPWCTGVLRLQPFHSCRPRPK